MEMTVKKKIWELALPATIDNLLQFSVGFIDTLMITRISLIAVTAIGVANTILNVYLSVFIALGVGATALISQKIGSNDTEQAPKIAARAIIIAIILGLLFGFFTLIFGYPLLKLIAGVTEVSHLSNQFFLIVGGLAIFISLMTTFSSILRAIGDMKSPMKVTFWVNITNILLSYTFVFVLNQGVTGLAIATVISRFIGCLLLFVTIQKTEIALHLQDFTFKADFKPLIKIAMPATAERLIMRLGQVFYFSLIVAISAKTFAAHMILGNIEMIITVVAYGLAAAITTLVGQSIGAKSYQLAVNYTKKSIQYAIALLITAGILIFFFAPYVSLIFTDDPEAISKIVIGARIMAINMPALATTTVITGALQGMGDTKSPLYSTIIGMWVIRIISVVVLSLHFDFEIAGVWLSIGLDLYMRATFLTWRFRQNIRKLEADFVIN